MQGFVGYYACMGKHPKRKKKTRQDTAEIARSVVEQAIGEKLNGEPLDSDQPEEAEDTRNQAAVALSKLGASKGGNARAKKLSKKRLSEIAKKAAKARWRNRSD